MWSQKLATALIVLSLAACGDVNEPNENPDGVDGSPKMQNAIYVLDSYVTEEGFLWDPVGKVDLVIQDGKIDGQISGCYRFTAKLEVDPEKRTLVVSDFTADKDLEEYSQCEKNYNFSMRPGNTGKRTFNYANGNGRITFTIPNIPSRDWKAVFRLVRKI